MTDWNGNPFWDPKNGTISIESTNSYFKAKFPNAKMFFDIWKEKLAFPLNSYPRNRDGTLKNLKISHKVKDSSGVPYWESIHQVALVDLGKFSDYIEEVRADPTKHQEKEYQKVAHVVAYDPLTLDLCFDPLNNV